jgi:hypothetical protein
MSQSTREEALDIAKSNISSLFHIEITDKWNAGWPVYAADSLADCWVHDIRDGQRSTGICPLLRGTG